MPMNLREFRELVGSSWEKSWGIRPSIRPPEDTAKEFVDYLLELGVLRERTKERIDVPDIYLYGLGLKRKGGVRKRG